MDHLKHDELSSFLCFPVANLFVMASKLTCWVPWTFSKTKEDSWSSPVPLRGSVFMKLTACTVGDSQPQQWSLALCMRF